MKVTTQECAGCSEQVIATRRLCFNPSGKAYVCRSCRHWHLGFASKPDLCHACGEKELYEKDMDRALCPECTRKLEEADKIVKAGGVYWSCSGCHSEGVLKPDHPLAKKMRATYRVQPPDPIVLNLEHCPFCKEKETEKEKKAPAHRVDTAAN